MDFDSSDAGFADDNSSDNNELPTSKILNEDDNLNSPIVLPVIFDPPSASEEEEDLDFEENGGSDEISVSGSSSTSSQSLVLNPNSSIDKLDVQGIALLKEIFPEESTDSLRNLHYKHIVLNKTSPSSGAPKEKLSDECEESKDIYEKRQQKSTVGNSNNSVADLPDDEFLRLPKSVAVLRQRRISDIDGRNTLQTYEFIQDLEMRAVEEYQLVGATSTATQQIRAETKYVEYNTYVVDKDKRFGLGMTLQEVLEDDDSLRGQKQKSPSLDFYFATGHEPQYTVIRYGLMVVGFLPDRKKSQNAEVWTDDFRSPAEVAGVRCDDVVIGINGKAFLLQVPLISSSSYSVDRSSTHYMNQKQKIIQSIQDSPSPVVLHVRRRRERTSVEEILSQPNASSLLDITSIIDAERGEVEETFSESGNFVSHLPRDGKSRHFVQSLKSSSSKFDDVPRAPPRINLPLVLHPLSIVLAKRKLIRYGEDQWRITRRLKQFTERARQCESSNSLRFTVTERDGVEKGSLVPHFDPNDLPPDMAALMVFPKDGIVDSKNERQLQDNDRKDGERSKISPLSVSNSNNDKRLQTLEQNHIQMQNHVGAIVCTPSTPTLPFDSPFIPMEYLQAFYGYEKAREIRNKSHARIRSALEIQQSPRRMFWSQQPVKEVREIQDWVESSGNIDWIPLHGIRKGLSARIVNSFVESVGENLNEVRNSKTRIAYTIWVYDLESGREWYAPIRYWEDFSNLYDIALTLVPTESDVYNELCNLKLAKDPTIPTGIKSGWSVVFQGPSIVAPMSPLQQRRRKRRNDEFDEARQQTSQQLEEFLRELLGIIYTCDPLHQNTAEIALYVQSFLGVEAGLEDTSEAFSDERTSRSILERQEDNTQKQLKRSIQRYSWRIFLLHTMKAIVKDFVDAAKARGPKLHELESMDADMTSSLKKRAMDELLQMQRFLDHLVDLILDGCNDDLRSISKRREYSPIHKKLDDESYWDRLVREAVREQVEIEVYVPLRSVISRLLVNGWRHEDMEVHFKIKELRKRPQGMFRIEKMSPSHWQSVARILKQGVGMSTLPCVKLRAIVNAAQEISDLHESEHDGLELLGADEFLPIFIFCVVRAEMERPCALSILLQTLCDRINRIGEIGYFLASFEAAIAHIKEIDLTEDNEDILSFLTVPLTEPLNE